MQKLLIHSFLPLLFTGVNTTALAPSIVGIWQLGTKQTGAGQLESYVFKADKTFEYRVNSSDGLQRIRAIGGSYVFEPGELRLTVKYTREVVGGTIDRSHITVGNDSWSI